MPRRNRSCRLGCAYGEESDLYSFPRGHPLSKERARDFEQSLKTLEQNKNVLIFKPVMAQENDLLLFHDRTYVDFVRRSSKLGEGYLDYGDTPSFKGVYEASLYPVGNSLNGLRSVMEGKVDHFFNPIGGLHHARKDSAGGFCVFDDAAIAISAAFERYNMKSVAYVDIDAHHGDGVFYGFEWDRRLIIGDIHEDGRYLYPGSGFASETGKGDAEGTKLNLPLAPGSGDDAFVQAFERLMSFLREWKPEFIFFQCGADGLAGDPLTHLQYSSEAHAFAANKLHEFSHEACGGRLLAMGGGGYNARNVKSAWSAVALELCS